MRKMWGSVSSRFEQQIQFLLSLIFLYNRAEEVGSKLRMRIHIKTYSFICFKFSNLGQVGRSLNVVFFINV